MMPTEWLDQLPSVTTTPHPPKGHFFETVKETIDYLPKIFAFDVKRVLSFTTRDKIFSDQAEKV
jgi:hypothetical protein